MTDTGNPRLLSTTWSELRRRRVVRAAVSYAVVVFVVLQLAEITFEPLGLPQWAMRWTILAAILGFPVVMSLAWYFDASRTGLTRDGVPARQGTSRLFAAIIVIVTVLALALWIVRSDPDGPVATVADDSIVNDAPANSIAVLPFADMSPERDQGWFADGVAEELLDRLSRIEGLLVAARTSSFAFRGRAADLRQIAAALKVSYLLEGSVRKAGGRLRVTAQLIDARNGYHLWSQTYERREDDIFALQDEVTAAIAAQLRQRIGGLALPMGGGGSTGATIDVRAHELYLKGRAAWRQRTPTTLAQAREFFQQAVAIEPAFARAWSGLADTYLLEADYGAREPSDAVAQAEPAAVRAVTLDADLAEGWASLGLLRLTAGQYAGAKANLERAIELDPDYTMASMWLASALGAEGDFAQQRAVLERARTISPFEPVVNVNLAATYAATGDAATGERILREVLAVLPNEAMLLRAWSDVEAERGALGAAASAAYAALRLDPTSSINRENVVDVELQLEAYDNAEAQARQLTRPSVRAVLLQIIALRRGQSAVVPELEALIAPHRAGTGLLPPEVREAFKLWAIVQWRQGQYDVAITALQRVVGDPARLDEEADLADTASLLAVAYGDAGNAGEAQRWLEACTVSTQRWLEHAPASARFVYVRALVAALNDDEAGAMTALERAYALGYRDRWQLANDPRLRALRDEPALQALISRIARDLEAQRRLADRDGPFRLPPPRAS